MNTLFGCHSKVSVVYLMALVCCLRITNKFKSLYVWLYSKFRISSANKICKINQEIISRTKPLK
jgi:hypothetical protein